MSFASTDVPDAYICPISQAIMKEPYIDTDGYSYDWETIVEWLQLNPFSPITRNPLNITNLVPNRALKIAIDEYIRFNGGSVVTKNPATSSKEPSLPKFLPCVEAGSGLLHGMAMWLINEVKIVPKAAEKYAIQLYDAEVGSIGRLRKKLTKNKNFLGYLKFDEDDIEDIFSALFPDKEDHTAKNLILPVLNTIPTLPSRNYEISAQFRGHLGGIWSVIELADGTICSGSADSSIRIWDVATLTCVKILGGHTNSVVNVIQLRDGRLCSGGMDKTVRIWNIETGMITRTFEGHSDSVFCLSELPNGRLLSGSADKTARVWNIDTGVCERVLTGHTEAVQFSQLMKDNSLVCTGSWDKTIRIFNVETGETVRVFQGHTDKVVHVTQLKDGRICSSSLDRSIRIWDSHTGICVMILDGHESNSRWVVEMPDRRICSCSKDKTLRIWNLDNGCTETILRAHTDYVRCLYFMKDGRLLSGSDDRTIRVWGSLK